jgi:hypothetical protein
LFLKCEGFNFAGSIKVKAATEMVEAADRDGVLTPHSILVESSSGNLGVALSMIAASKGYRFLCVTDSRCNLSTRLLNGRLAGFNGEPEQVHLLVNFPPAVAISRLIHSLNGVSSHRLRPEFPDLRRHYWRATRL